MPVLLPPRTFITLLATIFFVGAPSVPAHAATPKLLWATVNVCDTTANPDAIGIRASMPGTGQKKVRMFMRFRVEYFVASQQAWRAVSKGGDSGWVSVGAASFKARESGRVFEFSPAAGAILLRGRVSYEWRRGARVIRRETRRTEAGHTSSVGADPDGFSAAQCLIRQ